MVSIHKVFLNLSIAFISYFFGFDNIRASENKDQPERGYSKQVKEAVTADKFMVSTANPIATNAGYKVLLSGGSAIDAVVAIQMVLNVVEPQSSGIGGCFTWMQKKENYIHLMVEKPPLDRLIVIILSREMAVKRVFGRPFKVADLWAFQAR